MRIAVIGGGMMHVLGAAMMGAMYRSADVYAEFGVNGAVMSSNNITEHEQNMLSLPTSVRDGDDSITLSTPDDNALEGDLLPAEDDNGEDVQVDDGTDNNQSDDVTNEGGEDDGDADDFTPLGEPDDELVKASAEIDEYADGFSQMRAQAIKAGLPQDIADRVEREYEQDNQLSEDSLKELEKVGYSRGFVKSFIQGQEALAQTYVAQIQAYAGGPEKWNAITSHLQANSPDAMVALEEAISRQDLASIKTIINLGMASRTKKFGKTPDRSVNKRAPASGPKQAPSKGPKGFANQREMIAAMSDPKYQNDAEYRALVEQRVGRSSW
jgi:hypothetical protein